MDKVWDILAEVGATQLRVGTRCPEFQSLFVRDYDQAMMFILGDPDAQCVLFTQECTPGGLSRESDLLVGFWAAGDKPACFTVTIGGKAYTRVKLRPGEFAYAVDGRYVVPFLALRFHEVRLEAEGPDGGLDQLLRVGAVTQWHTRQKITFFGAYTCGTLEDHTDHVMLCATGMASVMTTTALKDDLAVQPLRVPLPDLGQRAMHMHAQQLQLAASHRMAVLREQLAAAAWRPERMRAWCLPHDDEFAAENGGTESGMSGMSGMLGGRGMWLGTCGGVVHVSDGAVLVEEADVARVMPACPAPGKHAPPALHRSPELVALLQSRLQQAPPDSPLRRLRVVGDAVTLGRYMGGQQGMHAHRDGSLQGGTLSLVLYLTTPRGGGRIVFHHSHGDAAHTTAIAARTGRCVLFDVDALHHVEAVTDGDKLMVACECMWNTIV